MIEWIQRHLMNLAPKIHGIATFYEDLITTLDLISSATFPINSLFT